MTDYCRFYIPGSTWFFTVNLRQRRGNHLLVDRIDWVREAFRYVKQRKPFRMEAVVIMPDHLYCIWTLPPEDTDNSMRWGLLKARFSHALPAGERISQSRVWNWVFIPSIGGIPGFSISRKTNVSNDALRSSAHPMGLLPVNADNGNGFCWGIKLDEDVPTPCLRLDSAFGAIRGLYISHV